MKVNTNDFINQSLLEAKAINKATMENAKINILEEINPKLDKLIKESLQEAEGDDEEDVVDDTTSTDSTEDTSTDDNDSAEGDDTESVEDSMEDITDDSEEIFSESDDDDNSDDDDVIASTDDEDGTDDFSDIDDDDEDLEEDINLYGNEHDLQSEDIDNDVQDDDIDDTDDSLTDDDNVVDDEDMDDDLKEILNIGENKKSTTKKFIKVEVAKYKNLVNENKKLKLGFTKVNSILKETTLLNSKLIYATKLFSKNSLNKQQKIKVVEKLDRAKSIKDVKLIYNSLNEGLSINKPQLSNSKKAIVEGLKGAKANVENAKQRKVLIESKNTIIPDDVKANFNRFAFYNPSK